MGILTFSINITLDGCVDHQEGIVDDETHAFFIRLMDEGGAMLWGRVATPAGVLLGSGKLATELNRLDLIDEYKFLVHPRIAGHGPTLSQSGLPSTRRLELVSSTSLRNGAVAMHCRCVSG